MTHSVQTAAFPDVKHILDRLCDGLGLILADELVGIYLYGSLATGDFELPISDIDLVVVMSTELDDRSFAALDQLHTQVVEANPEWNDRLELAYITRTALKTFRTQTSTIGIISPGEPFHLIQAGDDWLISWYALREDGVALHGPPIRSLIDPFSKAEYLRAVHEHIDHYRNSVEKPQSKQALSYIVLTVMRGAYTLAHGQPTSKAKAAVWAKQQYPQWLELIDQSLRWRVDPAADALTTSQIRLQVRACVHDILSRLAE